MSHDDNKTTPENDENSNDNEFFASNHATDKQTENKNWQNKNVWKRGLAMFGYGFVAGFVRMAITLIAIFQFFSLLFTEQANKPLVKLGKSLNNYMYQINQFLTINSEEYPFPFADWPESSVKIKNTDEALSE